jgi:hypothetical protein
LISLLHSITTKKENVQMSIRKTIILASTLIVGLFFLAACAGPVGPAGPAGPAGPIGPAGPAGATAAPLKATDLSCTQCHNDTTLIDGPETSWASSVHGSGPAFAIASSRTPCDACHTGSGFSDRIAAALKSPEDFKTAYANPTRIDCRACHQIHTTYTKDDFALKTAAAVQLYAVPGATFDGGMGNLCANCHQMRLAFPAATDGKVKVDSTHWGAHHGPEAAILLGVGGAGGVVGQPAPHYSKVTDTCQGCHMGGEAVNHTFVPVVATCQQCHPDAKSLDVDGVQTKVTQKLADVKKALQAKGLLDKDGGIVVGEYPEAQSAALWNFLLVSDDKSLGVHNATYINALLDQALAALK